MEEGDEEVRREYAQESSESARPLWEVHLEDVLMRQRACVGPCPPAHQVPQVNLQGFRHFLGRPIHSLAVDGLLPYRRLLNTGEGSTWVGNRLGCTAFTFGLHLPH